MLFMMLPRDRGLEIRAYAQAEGSLRQVGGAIWHCGACSSDLVDPDGCMHAVILGGTVTALADGLRIFYDTGPPTGTGAWETDRMGALYLFSASITRAVFGNAFGDPPSWWPEGWWPYQAY